MRTPDDNEAPQIEQQIVDGDRADEIFNSPIFQRVLQKAEERFVEEWRTSTETTKRESAWMKLKALETIQTEFRTIIGARDIATRIQSRRKL